MKRENVKPDVALGASSVESFCRRNGPITRATFYNWMRAGIAPATVKVGSRRLIPVAAEAAWLNSLQRQAEAERADVAIGEDAGR